MDRSRRTSFVSVLATLALAAAVPAFAATGCHASASMGPAAPTPSAEPTPPPPPPPPPDSDGDGIADADDHCPTVKGVKSDDPMKNGCPKPVVVPVISKRVAIDRATNRITISDKIMFKTGSSAIDAASDPLLDEIAKVIKIGGKDINVIEIAGHADKQGDVNYNLKLTQERAASVVKALVDRGVDAKKLRAKGYSSYCPIDAGNDELNRRVEFVILEAGGKPTNVPTGCPAALKAGIKSDPLK